MFCRREFGFQGCLFSLGVLTSLVMVSTSQAQLTRIFFGDDSDTRILGGVETSDFPSVGIVGSVARGGFCTGTLITPTHVLTAAHCAEVIEGITDGSFEVAGNLYATIDITLHPDYDRRTLDSDLAILTLAFPVTDIEPAVVFDGTPLVGDPLVIVGFGGAGTGEDGGDGTFGVKRVGNTVIDDVTPTMINWIFDDVSEANTASGDSGGPGFIDVEGNLFIASVTAGGTEPNSVLGDMAINTRVDAFTDWIDLIVLSSDGEDESGGQMDECDDYVLQAFPVLRFLIEWLTELLNFLTEPTVEADEPVSIDDSDDSDFMDEDSTSDNENPVMSREEESQQLGNKNRRRGGRSGRNSASWQR